MNRPASISHPVLGILKPTLPQGVRFEDFGDRWRLTATADLEGVATGTFADPGIHIGFDPARAHHHVVTAELSYLGFSLAQFAMPVRGGAETPFVWDPASNIDTPPAVVPLVIRSGEGSTTLLAPLDGWHEQIFCVDQDDAGIQGFRWGWHGDLDHIPAGTTATLGLFHGDSVTELFRRWGGQIRKTSNPGLERISDPVTTHLSYWTDNGAAYWYRTEPGQTIGESVATKLAELEALGVSVKSVELDSWFYPHEIGRPVTEVGYPEEVPPTGMLEWAPRPDVVPNGMHDLADRLGRPPLVLHSRHISAKSPYITSQYLEGRYMEASAPDTAKEAWWVDVTAHPVDPRFFQRWMADAASWGATCVEQDWMVMNWFGVRQLRAEPGRAMAWQKGLDQAAADHGLSLIWCMATPGDLMATVELPRVAAARTCDDYRYADDPARLWRWYLTVNRMADALGLPVSKDCFFTGSEPGESGLDGDPYNEIEALLSALSGGVAGIGDRIGRTDAGIVSRLCLADGRLVQPDGPIALSDVSFFDDGSAAEVTWAEANSGPWRYIVALHLADTDEPVAGSIELDQRYLVYDWRAETASPGSTIQVALNHREWALFVCCPIAKEAGIEQATIGDPRRYATMGKVVGDPPTEREVRSWRNDVGLADENVTDDAER